MMRHTAPLLLAAAVSITTAGSAHARNFVLTDVSPGAWTVIDPEGIETMGGGVVRRAWSVQVLRNILSQPPEQPGYVRTLTDYDCERREFRWREFSAFTRSGETLVTKQNPAYGWESVTKGPDTLGAYQVVCGQSLGRGIISAESVAKLVITIMASWDPPAAKSPPKGAPAARTPPTKPAAKAKPEPVRQLSTRDLWP